MSEIDAVCIVYVSSPDLPHRSWITRATHQNGEYITTNMGRFSSLTRHGVAPGNTRIKLCMEGDEDFQHRLDLAVTKGGYWEILPSHPHGDRIRGALDRGEVPR